MLKTQLLHSKMHAQNTALTLKDACSKHSSYTQICCAPSTAGIFKDAMLTTQLSHPKTLCSEHSSHTPRHYAQNTALTPQNTMLRTQLSHPKTLCSEHSSHTPKRYAQNTALTPQNTMLRTQLSHPKTLCSEHSSHTPKRYAQNTALTPQNTMLRTQLSHPKTLCSEHSSHTPKHYAQNTALTPQNAMLRTQLSHPKTLCSEHSSHTPKHYAQNTALTPQNTMLRTQLSHPKTLCSEHSSHTPKHYAQNTALTPQNTMLRTQLSHPKLKHFVSKILYKNKLRLKVLDLRALTFAEERSQCLQDLVRNRRAGGPPWRSSQSLLWPGPATGDPPCPQHHSWKRKPGDTQCLQFLGQMYLRVLILLTVCQYLRVLILLTVCQYLRVLIFVNSLSVLEGVDFVASLSGYWFCDSLFRDLGRFVIFWFCYALFRLSFGSWSCIEQLGSCHTRKQFSLCLDNTFKSRKPHYIWVLELWSMWLGDVGHVTWRCGACDLEMWGMWLGDVGHHYDLEVWGIIMIWWCGACAGLKLCWLQLMNDFGFEQIILSCLC